MKVDIEDEDDASPDKIYVKRTIFEDSRSSSAEPFKWKDIKHIELEDNDVIYAGYEMPDSDSDGHWYISIERKVIETDEQYQARLKQLEFEKKWAKERRKESYLRLKKEFENDKLD